MRYSYKAKTTSGDVKEGVIEADNRRMVIQRLQRQNLFPILVKEDEGGKGLNMEINLSTLQRIKSSDMVNFTRQMSDLLKSGLALVKALQVLEKQVENEKLRRVIAGVHNDVASGETFSDAIAKRPKVFGELYANMVRAGELGGMLDTVMERLADFSESELETRNKVVQAMVYPCILTVVGFGVIVLLLTVVLPKITVMFEDFGRDLPWITEAMIAVSDVVTSFWWLIAAALVGGIYAARQFLSNEQGQLAFDEFKLRLPVLGDLIRKREIAKFARTLGTLLSNGVSILKAMEIVEHTLDNRVLATHVREVTADIREGESLSKRLAETQVFPPLVVNMIAVGEETGDLENALMRVAVSYESSTDRAIKTATTLVEPLIILVMGGMVLVIALAMILPIMQLSSSF